jgi:glycosyltransferase involved in cell wall biosynthesis
MDVCLICYPFFPTKDSGRGVDRYCFELAENLARNGSRVELPGVTHGSSEGVVAAAKKLGSLASELPRVRADVYHAASPPAGAAAVLCARKPLVVSVHDLVPFKVTGYDMPLKAAYARWSTKLCLARAAAIIVPFQVTKDELVEKHGVPAQKIHVVHFGLDHATYYPRPDVPRATREVLYLGEVSRAKGVDTLIRAFAAVEQRVPDAKLLICGKPNQDRAGLVELSQSVGLKHVEFRGFVPEAELPTYYARAAVMTFPSRYGFGLSSLEAMACGTPVVVARTLDAPEFIADAGLLAAPGDAADLARCIELLLLDADARARFVEKGIQRAKLFSWREMAAKTAVVYEAARRLGS